MEKCHLAMATYRLQRAVEKEGVSSGLLHTGAYVSQQQQQQQLQQLQQQ